MSSTNAPNVAAVVAEKQARMTIQTRPIPSPGQGEILVRNHAIACNPVDWKIQDYGLFVENYPNVLGSDVAGIVVSIGSGVTHFQPGDRVTGFAGVIYNGRIDHGAWQTYTLLNDLGATKIPNSMSFTDASVFPTGMSTGAIALFEYLGVARQPKTKDDGEALLIWGAASSVGTSAVQIAHALGWKVFATASPHHHGWLKKLGATEVFDYRDADVVSNIAEAAKKSGLTLKKALDPISEDNTFDLVPAVVKASAGNGGSVALVLPWPEGKAKPEGVEVQMVTVMQLAGEKAELGRWFFNEWLEKALADGTLVPAPEVQIVDGGVEAAQKVFDMSKAGVSGKKLVVEVP